MGNLSTNFSRYEFACKCGCGFDTVDIELVSICEQVRAVNGHKPISPSSGSRCVNHNKAVGGSYRSQHLVGRAADFELDNPKAVYDALNKAHPGKYGIGLYQWGIHIDSRTNGPARWRGL